MRTPVLIAAHNEAHVIGRTLIALPRGIEPIVIANGCDDNTADVAANFANVTVLERDQKGKLPALQAALEYLGDRATQPLVTLDADSRPIARHLWIPTLLRARRQLDANKPACVVGPAVFNEMGVMSAAWRNVGHWRDQIKTHRDDHKGFFPGRNMLLDFRDQETLDQVLNLPHIWPGEDVAIKDVILAHGGAARKALHAGAIALTTGDRYPGIRKRLALGREASTEWCQQSYISEAPPDATHYDVYRSRQQALL